MDGYSEDTEQTLKQTDKLRDRQTDRQTDGERAAPIPSMSHSHPLSVSIPGCAYRAQRHRIDPEWVHEVGRAQQL